MISEIELLKFLNNKLEAGSKTRIDKHRMLIYTLLLNKISIRYSGEDIEKYVNDIFFEIFNYRSGIDLQKRFIKVFLESITKRKIIDDIYNMKKSNQIPIDDRSAKLDNSIAVEVVRPILLKDGSSQLMNDMKYLNELDSEIIIKNYCLNQSSKDISKKTGLKVSAYA